MPAYKERILFQRLESLTVLPNTDLIQTLHSMRNRSFFHNSSNHLCLLSPICFCPYQFSLNNSIDVNNKPLQKKLNFNLTRVYSSAEGLVYGVTIIEKHTARPPKTAQSFYK